MFVLARIQEWALTFAEVEMLTRNLFQSSVVLLDQFILFGPRCDHVVARDDQERVLPADRTSSEMVLRRLLVVGGSPLSDALKAERVVTPI